jgi:hypothetical protein
MVWLHDASAVYLNVGLPLSLLSGVLWGLVGASIVVLLDLSAEIGKSGDWPWRTRVPIRMSAYLTALVLRVLMGAGVAAGATASGAASGPLSAVAIGVATPLIIEKLASAGLAVAEISSADSGEHARRRRDSVSTFLEEEERRRRERGDRSNRGGD